MKIKNKFPLLFKFLEGLALFFIFALVNINSFVRLRQFPEVQHYLDHEGDYLVVAAITLILMLILLLENRLLYQYITSWLNNLPLIAFLAYATLSLFWTVYFPATLYKLAFLYFSSMAGAYIAVRYRLKGVISVLSWVGAVFAILSVLVVIFFPFVGMMYREYFLGSWTGILWHRNHSGNLFAFFSMLFLMRIFVDTNSTKTHRIIFFCLYLLSTLMVIGSRSATGAIVFLVLQLAAGLVILWLKFHQRLKPWHYYLMGSMLVVALLVFITNTSFFFGLLGRSASMTGRVPVWDDLIQRVYRTKPIFGYGYGALWMQKRFRLEMMIRHGWATPLYFADNGFLDILLNTGVIGLLLFLSIYIPLGVRSFRQAITSKSWIYFVPFLTFVYIFLGNLTYSFLLEVDQFVWMLLVIMVFATTAADRKMIAQP